MAFLAGTDLFGSAARTLWAMASDNALPKVLAEVHPTYDVPVWAIIATCLPLYFFGLIYIWNTTAFYGMMLAVMLMYQISYCLPIALNLFYGRRHMDIKYDPWCNGHLAPIVDAVSIIWTTFIFIFMCFPLYYPVTNANMYVAHLSPSSKIPKKRDRELISAIGIMRWLSLGQLWSSQRQDGLVMGDPASMVRLLRFRTFQRLQKGWISPFRHLRSQRR
jgi:amino acid transporter